MSDDRPVHWPSPVPYKHGYAACGVLIRKHVKVSRTPHFLTCPVCARLYAIENQPEEVNMTDLNPLPVAGYTTQSPQKVALVNQNKRLEEQLLRQLDLMAADLEIDGRWLAVARTQLEQGFMALNRAVFKPQRVKGDL